MAQSQHLTLGNPIHNGRIALRRSESAHLCHDFLGVAASECRNACFSSGACWMAARARGSSHRWVQRARQCRRDRQQDSCRGSESRKQVHGRYSPSGRPPIQLRGSGVYANCTSWFFSGNDRMRLPVAAKIALSTAGAATKIVGSPTPPQNPPDGMTMHSTSASRRAASNCRCRNWSARCGHP